MFSSGRAWWFSNVYFLFSSSSACPMKPELWSRAASWAELQCWAENINVPTMVLLSCCEIVKQDMASQRGRSAYRRTAEERSNPLGSSHLHPNQVHGAGGISSKFWPLLLRVQVSQDCTRGWKRPSLRPGDGLRCQGLGGAWVVTGSMDSVVVLLLQRVLLHTGPW